MKKPRYLLVLLSALALAATGTACGSTGSSAKLAADQNKDVLTIASPGSPASLDPVHNGSGDPQDWFLEPAYDSLLNRHPDGSYAPGLATAWGFVGSGNTTFDLTLRDGVTFSDGAKLTADAVKQWLSYIAKTGGTVAQHLNLSAVDVTGPLSLRLTLKSANPSLPFYLSPQANGGQVASPDALQTPAKLGTATFGAGPYTLDPSQTVTGQTYTYVPNPNYWNRPDVHWKKLVIKVIADQNAALLAMRSGQVDYMIGSPQTANSAKQAGFTVLTQPSLLAQIQFLDRNGATVPALGDVRVRQALNYALDRKAIASALFGTYAQPVQQQAVPGTTSYDPSLDNYYTYDVAKAKQLLAEAGYANGFTLPMIAFNLQGGENNGAQLIASYWQKIGVNVDIKVPTNANEFISLLMPNGRPSTEILYPAISDAFAWASGTSSGIFNPYKVKDATVDSLLAQAAAAGDAQRPAIWAQLQKRWLDLAWYAPFAAVDRIFYVRPGLQGVQDQAVSPSFTEPNLLYFRAG